VKIFFLSLIPDPYIILPDGKITSGILLPKHGGGFDIYINLSVEVKYV
jgi:hypothetical protein